MKKKNVRIKEKIPSKTKTNSATSSCASISKNNESINKASCLNNQTSTKL